jgi:hypothetical protein
MKGIIIFFLFTKFLLAAPAYEGFEGLNFIPTAYVPPEGEFSLSYSSSPQQTAEMNLIPYSFRIALNVLRPSLELGLTNTPLYRDNFLKDKNFPSKIKKYGTNIILPLYPSLKYQLMQEGECFLSVGVSLPYGFYGVLSDRKKWFFNSLLHLGLHTLTSRLGVLGGWEYDLQPHLKLILEANFTWATRAGREDTSFLAGGIKYLFSEQLFVNLVFRRDKKGHQQDEVWGQMSLNYLSWE